MENAQIAIPDNGKPSTALDSVRAIKATQQAAPKMIEQIMKVIRYSPDLTRFPNAVEVWDKIKGVLQNASSQALVDYKNLADVIQEHQIVCEQILNFSLQFDSAKGTVEQKLDLYFQKVIESREVIDGWKESFMTLWTVKFDALKTLFPEFLNLIGGEVLLGLDKKVKELEEKRLQKFKELDDLDDSKNSTTILRLMKEAAENEGELIRNRAKLNHLEDRLKNLETKIQRNQTSQEQLEKMEKENATEFTEQLKKIRAEGIQRKKELSTQRDNLLHDIARKLERETNEIDTKLQEITKRMVEGVKEPNSKIWRLLGGPSVQYTSPQNVDHMKWAEGRLLAQKNALHDCFTRNSQSIRDEYEKLIASETMEPSGNVEEYIKQKRDQILETGKQLLKEKKEIHLELESTRKDIETEERTIDAIKGESSKFKESLARQREVIENDIIQISDDIQKEEKAIKSNLEKLGAPSVGVAHGMISSLQNMNEMMHMENNSCADTGAYAKMFSKRFETMTHEIQRARLTKTTKEEFALDQVQLQEVILSRYNKNQALIELVENGQLEYKTIMEELQNDDILAEIGMTTILAKRSWRNFWETRHNQLIQQEEENNKKDNIKHSLNGFLNSTGLIEIKKVFEEESRLIQN